MADAVRALAPGQAIGLVTQMRRRLDAIEAAAVAAQMQGPDDARGAQAALRDRGSSRAERRRRARRGQAVRARSDLGDRMASGEMSGEQVDLLAAADEKSDGDALADDELIDQVAASSVDQGRKVIDDWLARRRRESEVEAEERRLQRARCVRKYTTADGMHWVAAGGDAASIAELFRRIGAMADSLYEADGGRDVPLADHARTHDQRMFDAFQSAVIGVDDLAGRRAAGGGDARDGAPDTAAAPGDSPAEPDAATLSVSQASTDERAAADRRDGSDVSPPVQPPPSEKSNTGSKRRGGRSRGVPIRAQVAIMIDADRVFGTDAQRDAAPLAEMIGVGPVSDAFVARYLEHAQLFGAVFARGEPLWLGRPVRHATTAQVRALILRDRGCKLCGADFSRCHAHHRIPYESALKGPTDIDLLDLVCGSCHRWVHDHDLTIFQNHQGVWTTRPATPDERVSRRSRPGATERGTRPARE